MKRIFVLAVCGGVLGLASPVGARAQAVADTAEALEELHELQREFEVFRGSRIPVSEQRVDGFCDERIGRFCIWFGGAEEENIPAEFREVGQARDELIRSLTDAFQATPHRWILGQLVHYLTERREVGEAERFAAECGIAEGWWCAALRGYVLHLRTEYVEAEAAFREALDMMPADVRHEWTTPRYIFTRDAVEDFNRLPPDERERSFELL